ncbi:hypothetical protein [Pseudomonas syringae]|uniref:hypothetical protein n=1 Tax=Pseudomonas syringae TaxID=317 RepID=UPI001F2985C2|nr:hypothetical protein [Pseudomonas syringae]MCF5371322.1 hypothetical protein [Pseudomonas syringae]MCF5382081.1 hypothetical protein [Pseudomonas syringae]MCF5419335.1 hypothetical protein [Pseudomonas syringae]MCF5454465.1 hypothetical protein [Pseudomonas syringae]MCF5458409.1 hypothetical protein [Pseudomonas syringae]
MNNSKQIVTGPTLRQFATQMDDDDLVVTSKLGSSTVSRVRFKRLEYPHAVTDQAGFLKGLVCREFPGAESVLGSMFDMCIADQAKVVNALLAG